MISTIKDRILLAKESLKAKLHPRDTSEQAQKAYAIVNHLGLNSRNCRVITKPGTTLIITDTMVVRLPHGDANESRCRTNKDMLIKLANTTIAPLVPLFLEEGEYKGQVYFSESKLPGVGLDIPISKMNDMVSKAADLITNFHKETAREIIIDESNFDNLFGKYFTVLKKNTSGVASDENTYGVAPKVKEENTYGVAPKVTPRRWNHGLTPEFTEKLSIIEQSIKQQLLNKPFTTVWTHGDYKIENILFNTRNWQITGLIDWDLSEEAALPLLDIFYLLMYKQYTLTQKSVANVFEERFLKMDLYPGEEKIINGYLSELGLFEELIKPLLIMFYLHHITVRYGLDNIDIKDVCRVVDLIATQYAIRHARYAIPSCHCERNSPSLRGSGEAADEAISKVVIPPVRRSLGEGGSEGEARVEESKNTQYAIHNTQYATTKDPQ